MFCSEIDVVFSHFHGQADYADAKEKMQLKYALETQRAWDVSKLVVRVTPKLLALGLAGGIPRETPKATRWARWWESEMKGCVKKKKEA